MEKKLLLVDDDQDFCLMIEMIFRKKPYELIIKKNAVEALEFIKNEGLDDLNLILLDIQMPKVSGFHLLEAIKKLKPGIPVVAVTALVTSNDKNKAVSMGFDDYLPKPFTEKELFSLIEPML